MQSLDGMIRDPVEHVGEPCARIDVLELARVDQREHVGGAIAPAVRTGEEPRLSPKGNLAVIVPISGRKSKSTIAGIPSIAVV